MTTLVKLTGFCDVYAPTQELIPVWVNPSQVCFIKPIRRLGQAQTRVFFMTDAMLEVAESCDEVLAAFRWCGLELTAVTTGI